MRTTRFLVFVPLNTKERRIRKLKVVATTLESALARSPTTIDGSAVQAHRNLAATQSATLNTPMFSSAYTANIAFCL